jgi:hypothetical protein
MGEGKKRRTTKPEGTAGTVGTKEQEEPKKARNKAELVSKVIEKIEARLQSDELKPTVGDFIRLLQLEKELEEEQPREIEVSWVEPDKKEDAPGE